MATTTPSPFRQALAAVRLACGGAGMQARAMRAAMEWEARTTGSAMRKDHATNPLQEYFDSHREGRGIWKWRHYFEVYLRHLEKFVGREVHLLEIGVYSGGSLEMWRQFFGPACRVYGVDIEPACREYAGESVEILIGDQADPAFWQTVRKDVPALDIVIDDGGHLPRQQIVSLEELLPHLRAGGVYMCEDVHGVSQRFVDYVSGLIRSLNAASISASARDGETLESRSTPFQADIHSIHSYPFLTVIEKTSAPVNEFTAPKHGTHWQPFL